MHLGKIQIFPIKSLDGLEMESARVTPGGFLENDRVYAIFDELGKVVNGKRTGRIHQLRCRYDAGIREVHLWENGGAPTGFLLADPGPISDWLTSFFGFSARLRANFETGFPDDPIASGPTVISEASLEQVCAWFPELSVESARRRFRSNLELSGGDEPFGEDRLYGAVDPKPFQLGEVKLLGQNPCQRCVVPTRDADSGEPISGFQKRFMQKRAEQLPPWAAKERFNHYYRCAVNTFIEEPERGKVLHVGDALVLDALSK